MKKRAFLTLIYASLASAPAFAQNQEAENSCTILLHGLARSATSMNKIADNLEAKGHKVINVDYPTTSDTIANLAKEYIPTAIKQCPKGAKINFVTHSMGGILVRSYYKQYPDEPRPNAVVMLGPPNQGSEIIDDERFQIIGSVMGDAGSELGTDPGSTPNQLGAVDFPTGVIAGNISYNPLYSEIIPGDDDGKVAVKRTELEGASDWIVLNTSHSFMMRNKDVINQINHFLDHLKFAK